MTNLEISKEKKPILLSKLEEKLTNALERIKNVSLDDIIDNSYNRIIR